MTCVLKTQVVLTKNVEYTLYSRQAEVNRLKSAKSGANIDTAVISAN